jgi:hypothetical protein
VASHSIGGDTVLLNFANGECYGLDPIGAEIWRLIGRGLSPRAASRAIPRSYDASPEQVERDILNLLVQLRQRGLFGLAPDAREHFNVSSVIVVSHAPKIPSSNPRPRA